MKARIFTDAAAKRCMSAWAYQVELNGYLIRVADILEKGTTCNSAEIQAIGNALKAAADYGIQDAELYSDSKFALSMVFKGYKTKLAHLIPVVKFARQQRARIKNVQWNWVPREHPGIMVCDSLCNEVIKNLV